MTPAEHYAAAEGLLVSCQLSSDFDDDPAEIYPATEDGVDSVGNALAAAQVHATLAGVDALREIGDQLDRMPKMSKMSKRFSIRDVPFAGGPS